MLRLLEAAPVDPAEQSEHQTQGEQQRHMMRGSSCGERATLESLESLESGPSSKAKSIFMEDASLTPEKVTVNQDDARHHGCY